MAYISTAQPNRLYIEAEDMQEIFELERPFLESIRQHFPHFVASLDIVDTLQLLLEISAGKREYVLQTFKRLLLKSKLDLMPTQSRVLLPSQMQRSLP